MQWRFWRWHQRDRDLEDEIAFDLAADAEERIRLGIPRKEAEQASHRDFGNVLLLKEDIREMWGWTWLERFGQDIRYGVRTLRGNLLFTTMAVLSLALGIGANTAIYSVMDAVLFRALPVRNPGELVILNWRAKQAPPAGVKDIDGSVGRERGGGWASADFPWPFYELLRGHSDVFSALFVHKEAGQLDLMVHGQAEPGTVEFVSGNFFSGLGILPAVGRLIDDNDNAAGASPVAVLSYSYWRDRFAGDPAAIGQTVRISNVPFTIAGITPPEFFGVVPGSAPVLYIPIVNRQSLVPNSANKQVPMFVDAQYYWADMIGRLRPGITMAHAQAELAAQFHQFALSAAGNKESADLPSLWVEEGGSGVDSLRRQYSKPLFILMTMVVFILAIACANIANLLLARATARRREMAVRLSLGASRLRVLRQLLTESVLLALPGGILGLGVAAAGIHFLVREDFQLRVNLDWRILAFTIGVSFATGILFGIAPALEAMRVDITPALKETRASAPRGRGRIGLGQLLVVAQIALSLLLVLGAALFVRTLANLHSEEVGFNVENLLTFSLNGSQAGYKGAALTAFYAQMEERLRVLPGVRAATVTDWPLVSRGFNAYITLPGIPKNKKAGEACSLVGPTFFETIQLPILLGRAIDPRDVEGAPKAAVINEVFAKKYFPNQNPVGRHVGVALNDSRADDMTIVGIAKNARASLKRAIPPTVYISYLQNTPELGNARTGAMFFELRTSTESLAVAGAVHKVVHEVAPDIPIMGMMTQSQRIDDSITQERTFADLCTTFAVLALMIACVGLYGSMAYAVSRRTNEIGIRMALGAERRGILWMILREVLVIAAAGLAIGFFCAWGAMPAIQSFLFGVKSADPLAILWAAGILIAALVLAGFGPATRASRIDPLTALRHE
jgi:predicted permease